MYFSCEHTLDESSIARSSQPTRPVSEFGQRERQRSTHPAEDGHEDAQSHQPESDDDEHGTLAIEHAAERHGIPYRQVPVDAHHHDGKHGGGYGNTCDNASLPHLRVLQVGFAIDQPRISRDQSMYFRESRG
jgi:hypothetical protein